MIGKSKKHRSIGIFGREYVDKMPHCHSAIGAEFGLGVHELQRGNRSSRNNPQRIAASSTGLAAIRVTRFDDCQPLGCPTNACAPRLTAGKGIVARCASG
jgi:hypothetical protein